MNFKFNHLPRTLAGDLTPLSLLISSSISFPSTQRALLLTLTSELALLLVANGESETLTVRLLAGPDLTLYIEDAGILVINGRRLPGMLRLISICLIAMSKDFLESVLPNPELSGDEDFADKLLWGECLSSCFGGANFRIFITLSTILVPINTGLTLSFALACNLLRVGTGTELPLLWIRPFGGLPLAGEHDCRLTLPLDKGSTDEDRTLGAPGRPLFAEIGLSGSVVLRFGGASRENPGISEGFHGLGLTVGELALGGAEFFAVAEATLVTEEEDGDLTGGPDELFAVETVEGLRVGVAALDVGFEAGTLGLEVGVDDLDVDLAVGVEERGGTVVLAEVKVAREVGVADLAGLDVTVDVDLDAVVNDDFEPVLVGLGAEVRVDLDGALKVGRPVGVPGLDPPDEDGRRSPPLEVVNPGDDGGCLDDKLLLATGSVWGFASFDQF